MSEIILQLKDIYKNFDDTEVLKGINLEVKQGEFITLLGPSGCGKTTTLRIIAGLEEPTSGQVFLENKEVTRLEPNHRDVNTVFQNYALFPHMTVARNVGYSQRLKRVSKERMAEDVDAALRLVQLEDYADRMPHQLSGGQMQRVAIARAIINQPKVLLLDEPLGALDLQLRYQMQEELKILQQNLGITFIYITHDQEEALNMSDRIVVMNDGQFEQIGTPVEIYDQPKTTFAAKFVGRANVLNGTVLEQRNDILTIETKNGIVNAGVPTSGMTIAKGTSVRFIVRREYASVACVPEEIPETDCHFEGIITSKTYGSGSLSITVELVDGTLFTSSQHGIGCPTEVGQKVFVTWTPEDAVLIDLGEIQ